MASESAAADQPVLQARGLVKRYGRVVALDHADFDLQPNEILGVIGDNGAGKSTLIKVLAGAIIPDHGRGADGRQAGPLPLADRGARRRASRPSTRTSRCRRRSRSPTTSSSAARRGSPGRSGSYLPPARPRRRCASEAREHLNALGLLTIQNIRQPVETLSGGQRQGVAVVRATAFGSRVIIMDEPTAALGVKESRKVLELMLDVKKRGLPIILISHNMPHVFEVADRIHIHRLGRRIAVIDPKEFSMSDAVAIMTGAMKPPEQEQQAA